ncbi:MAG: hypothetical protein IKD69_08785, partial [Solobacterium sp.]|nr:hypothetical protein [Solobacterium sp.]
METEGTPHLHFAKVGDDPQVTVQTFVLKAQDEQTMVTRGKPEPMYADITIDVQGPVRFLKKDLETGEGVEGAVLRFYDEEWNFIDEIVSAKTPVSLDTDKFIRNKAYYIVETKAPKNYEIIEAPNPNWYGTWSKPDKDRQGNAIEGTVVDITWLGTDLMETISVSNKRKTQLRIRKSNAAGSPLAGAVLALYDGSTKITEWTTKTDEEYHTLDAEIGKTYTVKETKVPEGYVRPKETSVTINGNDTEVTIRNIKVSALKTDNEGNPLSGAKMEVRDDQNKIVDSWTSTLNAHDICNLEEGRTYTLVETQAPKGFLVGDPVTFTPGTEDQLIRFVDDNSIVLRIRKADTAGNPVAGAKLQLLDGTKVIDSWTTEENEEAHTVEVEKGKTYTVHEETAPQEYVRARDVNVTIKDEITDVTMTDIQVKFLKLDKEGRPLAGARIQVNDPDGRPIDEWTTETTAHVIVGLCEGVTYTAYETKAPAGYELADPITFTPEQSDLSITMTDDDENGLEIVKVDASGKGVKGAKLQLLDGDTVVDEWESDGTEKPHSVKGIVAGKPYIVHEQEAPAGYVRMKDIVITANTGITKITLRNYRISIRKTDGAGVMLAKARLQVIDGKGNVADEWETDGAAHIVNGLEEGKTYILKEVEAPLGYQTADEITFTAEQKDISFTMVDEVKDLHIAKKDTEGNTVSGALLRLLDGDQVIDEWETGSEESHAVSNAMIGRTYTIHEERAPAGYVRAKDIVFTMKAGENGFVMRDFQIAALKTDENGIPLAGAKLEVTDASGKVTDSWESSSEPHFINNLNEGETYTLTETEAPFGYFTAAPITFTAEEGTRTITMADAPQTVYVNVEKQDAVTHLPLAGAEFTVYRKADGEIAEDT